MNTFSGKEILTDKLDKKYFLFKNDVIWQLWQEGTTTKNDIDFLVNYSKKKYRNFYNIIDDINNIFLKRKFN